jgi:hypothetical protein
MVDTTEFPRRRAVAIINAQVESSDKDAERVRLEAEHGQVWNTEELSEEFTVDGFMAPFVTCTNKETGKRGAMMFQHMPRFYFDWKEM